MSHYVVLLLTNHGLKMNNFARALSLTMQLHALFKMGMGASAEADEVRDQLDEYHGWCSTQTKKKLSQENRELLGKVSAALSVNEE